MARYAGDRPPLRGLEERDLPTERRGRAMPAPAAFGQKLPSAIERDPLHSHPLTNEIGHGLDDFSVGTWGINDDSAVAPAWFPAHIAHVIGHQDTSNVPSLSRLGGLNSL